MQAAEKLLYARSISGDKAQFMQTPMQLMRSRQFLPLFVTQFLGAFNDNLFRTAMVILAIYTLYDNEAQELAFSNMAQGLFILPFFLFSAVAGQLADTIDKARLIRWVKTAEIFIMCFGAAGIWMHNIPLMFVALFAMGIHSTFFGPIKYAIIPQHLPKSDVLLGTGLVEAGTYIAILLGQITGGIIPPKWSAIGVLIVAVIGRISGSKVPDAPHVDAGHPVKPDFNIFRASWRLMRDTLHVKRIRIAIFCISFFWAIGALLGAQFPPLVKNAIGGDEHVATLFLAIFSIGIAVGSIAVNKLLKGSVSARFSPVSAVVMSGFVLLLWWGVSQWGGAGPRLIGVAEFVTYPLAELVMFALFGIAVFGGMYVVPLYAFLTVTVAPDETARTIAANNIVNSGFMVAAALSLGKLIEMGATVTGTLLFVAVSCLISAASAVMLERANTA
jgi:MFS family permease